MWISKACFDWNIYLCTLLRQLNMEWKTAWTQPYDKMSPMQNFRFLGNKLAKLKPFCISNNHSAVVKNQNKFFVLNIKEYHKVSQNGLKTLGKTWMKDKKITFANKKLQEMCFIMYPRAKLDFHEYFWRPGNIFWFIVHYFKRLRESIERRRDNCCYWKFKLQ